MTNTAFREWALKNLGFFITPGTYVAGSDLTGAVYNHVTYGQGIVVFEGGHCHPANLCELKMYNTLKKLKKVK